MYISTKPYKVSRLNLKKQNKMSQYFPFYQGYTTKHSISNIFKSVAEAWAHLLNCQIDI